MGVAAQHEEEPPAPRRRRRPRVPTQLIAFVGVLCAGLLIGWVLFHRDDSAPAPSPGATAAQGRRAVRIPVGRRVNPRLGLAFGLPKGWRTSIRRGVLNAASGDDTVSVAISAAGGPADGAKVRRSDRDELARLFNARELTRQRAKVGSAPTIVTEFVGRTRKRRRIRILSMGASSRWRTYSIQVFTVLQPTTVRLLELRTLLASVRYRQPR